LRGLSKIRNYAIMGVLLGFPSHLLGAAGAAAAAAAAAGEEDGGWLRPMHASVPCT